MQNTLVKKPIDQTVTTFDANGAEIKLSPKIVRDYLVSGNRDSVSFQELAMFINLCKYQKLNPWLREAYLIKYGQKDPATLVVGKEAFMKRAEAHPKYNGFDAGVVLIDNETGEIIYRSGTIYIRNAETIIGGYAKVYRKDVDHPFIAEVSFDEYAGKKADGTLNSQWAKKPATMIRKVALVQALREAFPNTLGGMFTAEEQGEVEAEATEPMIVPEEASTAAPETPAEVTQPERFAEPNLFEQADNSLI